MRDYGLRETNRVLGRRGRRGWASLVKGIKKGTYRHSTGYYTQTMNQGTLYQYLMMYCMVTNIAIKNKIK